MQIKGIGKILSVFVLSYCINQVILVSAIDVFCASACFFINGMNYDIEYFTS